MADTRAKTLQEHGNYLFEKKRPLNRLHQEIAENFYPEMADFTASRNLGEDFASSLTTSYPVLARRDLANAFSAMLRPQQENWFGIGLARKEREDNQGKKWLEWASQVQRRAMYDRVAGFVRATKQGDNDFAAFGQCVISGELNREGNALLYRTWHLRDVAWCEKHDGSIGAVHRNWTPTARQLASEFRLGNGRGIHTKVIERLDKDPYGLVKCRHIIVPSDEYDAPSSKADYEYVKPGVRKWKTPYISVHLDVDNQHVMEEVPTYNQTYVIPRWQLVSGSQYAYSPATVAALPDARLIQAMTLTLLEAGEKAVNPPLIGVQEAVRSDVQVFSGGITWVDAEYDERLGEVLRPMTIDSRGIPIGMEMRADIKEAIASAFYLNKLNLPMMAGDMTATEVSQRVQEYIRNALPLFEPMEAEYNGALCDLTFDILLRGGAFGSVEDMPQSLRGQEIEFRFESPLREAAEKKKGQTFMEAKAMLAQVAEIDPGSIAMMDSRVALRDVLNGIGVPAKWIRDEEAMQQIDFENSQRQQSQELLAAMNQGATVAQNIGNAGQALQGMQMA